MPYIDLHIHSTFSDGFMSPKDIVMYAKKIGLKTISITDHDTIKGIFSAIKTAKEIGGIEIIPGIEFTSYFNQIIHILGYFIPIHNKQFNQELSKLISLREKRNNILLEKLKRQGIKICKNDFKNLPNNNNINRPNIALLLIKKGYVNSYKEAFDNYIGNTGLCFVKHEIYHTEKIIKLINQYKGISILAHPYSLKLSNKEEYYKIFKKLKSYGLDGIEVYHSHHSKNFTNIMLSLANHFNFIITGGSDFHGDFKPDITMGFGKGDLFILDDIALNLKKFVKNKSR